MYWFFFCQEYHIENYTFFSSNISEKHLVRMFSAQIQSDYWLRKLFHPLFPPWLHAFTRCLLENS